MRITRDAARHHGLRRACLASDPKEPLLSSTCRRHALRRSLWTVLVAMCGSCVWLVAQRSAGGAGNHIADLARDRSSSATRVSCREVFLKFGCLPTVHACGPNWCVDIMEHFLSSTLFFSCLDRVGCPACHGWHPPVLECKERSRRPRTRMTAPLAAVWH